ncbi:hypothetical protein Q7P37_009215 [Cladosporium fusiforme]
MFQVLENFDVGRMFQDAGNTARGLITFVPEQATELLADRNSVVHLATKIFNEAEGEPKHNLVNEVVQGGSPLIEPGVLESALGHLSHTFQLIPFDRLMRLVIDIGCFVLHNTMKYIREIPFLRDTVFSNDINSATLQLIFSNPKDLIRFLVDVFECTKAYAINTSRDGNAPADDRRGQFNELDLSSKMNRHAAICQLQRFVLSLAFILRRLLENIRMGNDDGFLVDDTADLRSDAGNAALVHVAAPSAGGFWGFSRLSGNMYKNERWLFINGIAGEYHWTRLACDKLAHTFGRNITGIVNRGDGILWDLIECAGERRTADSQKQFIRRTRSSHEAEANLVEQLREALDDDNARHVVVIAHSQGCLILRLALDTIIANDAARLERLRTRLCVFTFGNPSVDWELDSAPGDHRSLVHYVHQTEHFANTEDFVAKLGVLRNEVDEGRYGAIFENAEPEWFGHLFGAQYSLDPNDYVSRHGERSLLLACKNRSIRQVEDTNAGN